MAWPMTKPTPSAHPNWTLPSFAIRVPLLRQYTMAQLIQVTIVPTPRPSKPRLLVAWTDEYDHNLGERLTIINNTTNLSEGLPIINNTTTSSERLPVINNMTNLNEGLPVINDMTNLSKGLLVINDTSAKMTCVVDNLCGCPLNQCLNDLCGQGPA